VSQHGVDLPRLSGQKIERLLAVSVVTARLGEQLLEIANIGVDRRPEVRLVAITTPHLIERLPARRSVKLAGEETVALAALKARLGDNLEAALAVLPCPDAIAAVHAAGGKAVLARINQREAFFDDPVNRALKLAVSYPHKVYGRFEQVGTFFDFGDLDTKFGRAPPVIGEHSREILAEFGFAPAAIDAMLASGLVVAPD